MRLQAAIFDMDGTLLDSMGMWNGLGTKLLRARGIEPKCGFWDHVKPMTLYDGAVYCVEDYHLPETPEELVKILQDEIEDFYHHEAKAKPGVDTVLSMLKMEGVWMYIATGTDRPLAEAGLKHAGIDHYFRGLVTCGEVGIGKDKSAKVFEDALIRLRTDKKNTVVFEDSLPAIRTAKAAGFRVAGVYDPSFEAEQEEIKEISDYYIYSFKDLFEETIL